MQHAVVGWCLIMISSLTAVGAQLPDGYHLGRPSSAPDSLIATLAGGRFHVAIRRVAATPKERSLITMAERLYPSRETVFAAALLPRLRDHMLRMDSLITSDSLSGLASLGGKGSRQRSPGNPDDRWWWDAFDGTWSPYAVTGATADYYLARMRDMAEGRGWFPPSSTDAERGSFSYVATVQHADLDGAAYVVHLRIEWQHYCGMLCADGFSHERTVTFDRAGQVLRISGDRTPNVVVS